MPVNMEHYLSANEARELAENHHRFPKLVDAVFEKIRKAAESGEYGTCVDFPFITTSYMAMSREDASMRARIIKRIKDAGYEVDDNHYGNSSPSVYVSWSIRYDLSLSLK